MSQTRPLRRPTTGQSRREAAQAATARRRWWRIGSAGVTILLVAGVILGLHYANRPHGSNRAAVANPATGRVAPPGTFTTLTGHPVSIASLKGQPTLLWFVSTWCSSCQAGTQAVAQNLARLHAAGVRVEEVELYADLGQPGPSMPRFAQVLAGPQFGNPAWTFGVSSAGLTHTYDPQSYLDIYYLLNAQGHISYVNSSPSATMPQLLAAAKNLA